MSTVGALLAEGARALEFTSSTPRLDAELLLAFATGFSRISFVADPDRVLVAAMRERYQALIERRRLHEPLAYITGVKEFFGLDFEVSPAVLVPRPETEHLVEVALRSVPTEGEVRFLDLGTGSGCIAIAFANEMRRRGRAVRGLAVDTSEAALAVARRNVERHGLQDVIELRRSDWFSALGGDERFELMMSNPPYIAPGDTNISPELCFEPHGALYAEECGLADLRRILIDGPRWVVASGSIVCEFGSTQRRELEKFRRGVEFFADLAGHDRVLRYRP